MDVRIWQTEMDVKKQEVRGKQEAESHMHGGERSFRAARRQGGGVGWAACSTFRGKVVSLIAFVTGG